MPQERDNQGRCRDRDDGHGDEQQPSGPRSATVCGQFPDGPDQRAHGQYRKTDTDVPLEDGPADCGHGHRGPGPGESRPLARQAGVAILDLVRAHARLPERRDEQDYRGNNGNTGDGPGQHLR